MKKLLGIQVAHGFSSETQVFATLLSHRNARYESCVLMHQQVGAERNVDRFAAMADTEISTIDTGWRANDSGNRLSADRLRVVVQYLRRIDASIDFAQRYRPDVVYSSQQHYDCRTATKVARSLDVPQIVHLHYIIGPWLRRLVTNRLQTADHVVAVSDFIRQQALTYGVPSERVTTIRNTILPFPIIDPETIGRVRQSLGVPLDAYVYGMVSRLDPGKGHFDAIAAFELSATTVRDAYLVIVGSGREAAAIRKRAAYSSVATRIRFTGRRTDVPDLLGTFDAFVHPAVADPCPLAVLEAMASRLPVVAFSDGGLPELVDNGVTGLLVPVADVTALAAALTAVREDTGSAQRMGAAGATRITTHFSPAEAGTAFADLVTSVS